MQPNPQSTQYKIQYFTIYLTQIQGKKFNLRVYDKFDHTQYEGKGKTLEKIDIATMIKAFQQSKEEIKANIVKKGQDKEKMMEVQVLVSPDFLLPIKQIIALKMKKQLKEYEVVSKKVQQVKSKIHRFNQNYQNSNYVVFCGKPEFTEKTYSDQTQYMTLGSIKLPQGKYMFTITFILKAKNRWINYYINQTRLNQNCGFYEPNQENYFAHRIRAVHEVKKKEEKVNFKTSNSKSYPIIIRNLVITAQRIE